MKIKEKLKDPFVLIVLITLVSLLPMVALLFDRLMLNLSYSSLFYIEITAGIIFISAGFIFAFLFIKSKKWGTKWEKC